jgi:NADH-quinone oxidoreductase subunit E
VNDHHRDGLEVLTGELAETGRAIADGYPHRRSALLPLLFLVQSVEGYVTEAGMRDVAALLGLTPAEVLAAGSFYTMLKKKPQGDYLISICRNISCTHLGARRVIAAAEERLGIEVGETTSDGRFTLEAAECLATCDGAPAIQINYEDFYDVTPGGMNELIDELSAGEEIVSVRGEPVKTIKEVSRETALAGARLPDTLLQELACPRWEKSRQHFLARGGPVCIDPIEGERSELWIEFIGKGKAQEAYEAIKAIWQRSGCAVNV